MKIETVLESTLPEYKEKVIQATSIFADKINKLVAEIFDSLDVVDNKPHINTGSKYALSVFEIMLYMRYGTKRNGRFGHNYICISNIDVGHENIKKGFFTAFVFRLIAECKERKVILHVENPLEPFFQEYLLRIGFICLHRTELGLGTFHFPIENQISDSPYYNLENY